jgi:hypothetical protein
VTYGKVRWAGFDEGGHGLFIATDNAVIMMATGDWRERLRLENEGSLEALRVGPDGSKLAILTRWNTGGHDSGAHLTRIINLTSGAETGWQYTTGGSNISQNFIQAEAARKNRALAGGDTVSIRESGSWRILDLSEPSERTSGDGTWQVSIRSKLILQDAAAGRRIAEFDHGGTITSVRFIPAFAPRWLVSAGDDGTLAVWPIRTTDLADQACERLGAMLNPEILRQLMTDAHAERSCPTN